MKTLPHYLRPGLRLVFVGYNPAIYSAEAGHYYARSGNTFWKHLHQSGLTPRLLEPTEDASLMDEFGYGFVDLCPRPTVRADELEPAEIAEGAIRLHDQLLAVQPDYAVISGKGILQHFGAHVFGVTRTELGRRPYGVQPERIGMTKLYMVPSSSGLASRWHRERLQLLVELRELLGEDAR